MAQCSMKHENVRWNPATQEWFCVKCGRTSDHATEQEAHFELEQHECKIPWAEIPETGCDTFGER